MALVLRLLTWNTQGRVEGTKLDAIKDEIDRLDLDVVLLQESPHLVDGTFKHHGVTFRSVDIAADTPGGMLKVGGGGYGLIFRVEKLAMKKSPTYPISIDIKTPVGNERVQSPVRIDLSVLEEDVSPGKIVLHTWHAPYEHMVGGTSDKAYRALEAWKASLPASEMTKANDGRVLWVLGADLNMTLDDARSIFKAKWHWSVDHSRLDFVVAKFGRHDEKKGNERLTVRRLSAKGLDGLSDHAAFAVEITCAD